MLVFSDFIIRIGEEKNKQLVAVEPWLKRRCLIFDTLKIEEKLILDYKILKFKGIFEIFKGAGRRKEGGKRNSQIRIYQP